MLLSTLISFHHPKKKKNLTIFKQHICKPRYKQNYLGVQKFIMYKRQAYFHIFYLIKYLITYYIHSKIKGLSDFI